MSKYTFKSHFATEFEAIPPKSNRPTILYLHGFCSDCWGAKPETVKKFCLDNGCGLFRFEYAGHGSDKENFENADFAIWKSQVLEIIDEAIAGDVICVGSSLGGWLGLLAAIERPQRVKGFIGLAAAPNFITRFAAHISPAQKHLLETTGKFDFGNSDFTYCITRQFINTAMENLLDENESWPVLCPVRLLQGTGDSYVNWQRAPEIAGKLLSDNVIVHLLKNSDHRLNDDMALRQLEKCLYELGGTNC